MSTEVWSYVPTGAVVEEIEAGARGVQWLGAPAVWTSVTTANQVRRFSLAFGPCTHSAEISSMFAFYRARLGSFDPFVWLSPMDARTYLVRFDSTVRADLFEPGLFRSGAQLAFTSTYTPDVTTVTNSVVATEFYSGSGAVHPDASSGDGVGRNAFWWPDAWYLTGYDMAEHGGTNTAHTSNRLQVQPFWNATSGVPFDRFGVFVTSGLAGQVANVGLYISRGESGGVVDVYPGSLVAASSIDLSTRGWLVASVPTVPLENTVWWVGLVTSFTGAGARFAGLLVDPDGTVLGTTSAGAYLGTQVLYYTHSMTLPGTFPSSAQATGTTLKVGFHIGSEAV